MIEPSALMTAREVAERLGCKASQLGYWESNGTLQPTRLRGIGPRWYRSDVEAFAAATRASAARLSSPRLGGETLRNGRRWNGRQWTMDGTHAG